MQLRITIFSIITLLLLGCDTTKIKVKESPIKFVDPFIGTDYHGHTFPGATMPFGMVQLSPDTRTLGWDACSGYHYSDSSILGFSHTHLSGTGIGDYGDILFMPFTGDVSIMPGKEDNPDTGYRSRFQKNTEKATPGYYKVFLDDYNIKAELTATNRVGLHQYTFPQAEEAGIIIDLQHTIHGHQNTINEIKVINEYEIEGFKNTKGWADNHYVFFKAKFSKPFEIELYENDNLIEDKKSATGTNVKVKLKFSTKSNEKVWAKVAISGVDNEGAAKNLDAELPDWDFDAVVEAAQNEWIKQLSKIEISDTNIANKRTFYTALYHSNLSPTIYNDVDGRYRGMDHNIHTSEHNNYTVYSLWDTYRAQHPLFTIIKPEYNQDLIRALLRKYEEGGILPMWELASNYTGTMIGSHAVSVIADAYMKGYRDFDTELALEAMIQSVVYDSVKPIPYPNERVKTKLMPKAKLYVDTYGFVPADMESTSVSKALEFAYNYWCIAEVAKDMGKSAIAEEYYAKSKTYDQYFDTETGFMRGKKLDGTWTEPFDPAFSDHWKTDYVEGNAWQWTWYVPHDVEGLINLYGSKESFATKLDSLFTTSAKVTGENASSDITGLIGQYAHGNEPSHHIAYLFNYADQPWRTQEIISQIRSKFYTDKPDGLCGNEDCGQMSAWYILSSMGFYPVCPGSTEYSIGKPLFTKIVLNLENGNRFRINTKNLSASNKYVKKVLLNGEKLTTPFISHSDIAEGKELTFIMGSKPVIFWK
ncbi:MAG: glycoside hydrolase family 92 protein [Bacteroidetes bacterium]|nr:MAG: glycoside hydrolase family 92 protein [Bacteroidota bacterium]